MSLSATPRRGQSIRIYLADGAVTGVRHAEVVNWTGQALACPRNLIGELRQWDESQRPGVYLLFGLDDLTGRSAVYVGEAEHVLDRMQEHLLGKDFWSEVVLFTNKDQNLTKAHVRYLESRLLEVAKSSRRYLVLNSNSPSAGLLPRGDRDAMEDFLDQARLLLGVLGHKVLEPLTSVPEAAPRDLANGSGVDQATVRSATAGTRLLLTTRTVQATGVLTNEGIVVLSGSQASGKVAESMAATYQTLREELLQQHVLVQDGASLRFAEDYLFSSPSAAACIVVGYAINGREAWKTEAGVSVGQLEKTVTELL